MVKLVSEEFSNFYFAEFCSKASFVCILTLCLTFLAPFYLSFTTNNFWLTLKTGYEHPNTSIVQLIYVNPGDASTIESIQIYPVWKDKKYGELNFERVDEYVVDFTIQQTSSLNLEFILEVDYELTDVSTLNSRSQIFLQFQASYYFDSVKLYGDLRLSQQYPLSSGGDNEIQNVLPYYNANLQYQDYLRQNTFYKNQTVFLDYEYFTQILVNNIDTFPRDIQVQGRIHIPRYERILYVPSLTETYKFAWAAYFSIMVVLLYFTRELLKRIYRYSIFPVAIIDNLPLKAYTDSSKLKQD